MWKSEVNQVLSNDAIHIKYRPIPGKVKLLLISGKKSASLLDHISRFLSHQFVTWYLRSISKTKIVKLFCPCMSEHMIYIKNVPNVTPKCHKRDQTKYCIKRNPDDRISYEVYEIVCKCCPSSVYCSIQNSITHQRIFTLKSFWAGP